MRFQAAGAGDAKSIEEHLPSALHFFKVHRLSQVFMLVYPPTVAPTVFGAVRTMS